MFVVFLYSFLIGLPTSKFLSLWWNLGSLLAMIMVMQIFSGFFLTFFYICDTSFSFFSVDYIMRDVTLGWFLRLFHFNGASFFFFILYLHIFKAFFYMSYRIKYTWMSGVVILLVLMAVAFLGYVLVWAQMSYWAAVVITSLISVLPFGSHILLWVWGGFGVSNSTLSLFYSLHFLIPWVLFILVFLHLVSLHSSGSTSILYYTGFLSKGYFYPFYFLKDAYNFLLLMFFMLFFLLLPFILGDPEMFIEANNLVSPAHILPEWYFDWAYGILRSIPNKSLGVIGLLFSVLVTYSLTLFSFYYYSFSYLNKFFVITLFFIYLTLGWLGQCPAEDPFVTVGFFFSMLYFFFFFLYVFLTNFFTFMFF